MKTRLTLHRLQRLCRLRTFKHFPQCATWTDMEWGCALAGEVGELCNFLKKRKRDIECNPAAFKKAFRKEIAKELADVQQYVACLANAFDLDLEAITKQKFNEVSRRVKSKIKL